MLTYALGVVQVTQELHLANAERDRALEKLGQGDNTINERIRSIENRCQAMESQLKSVTVDVPDIETQVRSRHRHD